MGLLVLDSGLPLEVLCACVRFLEVLEVILLTPNAWMSWVLGSSSLRPKEMLNSDQVSCVSSLFIFLLIYKHIKASKIEGHIRWRPLFKFPALFPENYQNKVPIYILKPLKWEFLPLLFSVLFAEEVKKLCATQFNNIFFLDWLHKGSAKHLLKSNSAGMLFPTAGHWSYYWLD